MPSHASLTSAVSNPFATRFTRPGAVAFRFPVDKSIETIRHRLQSNRWCGQIVGPHGSGKTTLLRTLDNYWQPWDRQTVTVTLRDGHARLPLSIRRMICWTDRSQLIVDGYERLGLISRFRLALCQRLARFGLMITAHRDLGFPTIWRTSTDTRLAVQLVRELAGDQVAERETLAAFHRVDGNIREMFFNLYDSIHQLEARTRR
jgi:energy-coupling factor transporter ATP-binding protein EcfA2